jgi:hypothetical protein
VLFPVGVKSAAPRAAGGPALGAREEVLERDVQEGSPRLGEELVAVAKVAVDVDSAASAVGHPGGESELTVDERGPAVADEDPRGHRRETVPGGEEAAGLVEGRPDEPAVHDPRPGLVALAEGEGGLVALDPLPRRQRKVDAVRILLPATPARGVVVRRNLYRRPPRSK